MTRALQLSPIARGGGRLERWQREVVSRYLERAGYAAWVAGDGPRALQLASAERPDLVVLDLMLPGMDGLEVMRRRREHERIAVSFYTDSSTVTVHVRRLRAKIERDPSEHSGDGADRECGLPNSP